MDQLLDLYNKINTQENRDKVANSTQELMTKAQVRFF